MNHLSLDFLREPACITGELPGNNQLLYFTSSSLLEDDRRLIYISDRTGNPNLYLLDMQTRQDRQLTRNEQGYLKSYVYFDGRERQGLGKASASLDVTRGVAYYLQGDEVCAVNMDGAIRKIARIPADQVTAFTHVSSDGRRLCVPTTDARALAGPFDGNVPGYDIDKRVQDEALKSTLWVFDTETGNVLLQEEVPRAWITHVQFNPSDPEQILYNHEWPSDCGIRRVWLWDGRRHVRLRDEEGGRSRKDWVCHETWTTDGKSVIYHGRYSEREMFIGRLELGRMLRSEIPLAGEYRRYGHFSVSSAGWLVSDGYYQEGKEPQKGRGEWISLQRPDWDSGTVEWIPLCRHLSNWDSQDSHPHPIYNHRGNVVFFTSNRDGRRQVYAVSVPEPGKQGAFRIRPQNSVKIAPFSL